MKNITLRTVLFSAIGILAIVSLLLVIISEGRHKEYAYESHQYETGKQIKLSSQDLLDRLKLMQRDLGLRMQSETEFKQVYQQLDYQKLVSWLEQEYHRYFVTAGLLDLNYLWLWDKKFDSVVRTQSMSSTPASETDCTDWMKVASSRQGAKTLKPIYGLCEINGKIFQYTVVIVGGLRVKGYLQVISDPVHNLRAIEDKLGLPVRIYQKTNSLAYEADSWLKQVEISDDYLIATSSIGDDLFSNSIKIETLVNLDAFNKKIAKNRNILVGFTILLIFVVFYTALYLMQKGLLPLEQLQKSAGKIANGDFVKIKEKSGLQEIDSTIQSFNKMLDELSDAKDETEHKALQLLEEKNLSDVTLSSLVNGVIVVMSSGHIRYQNDAAEEMTKWPSKDAVGQRLDDLLNIVDDDTGIRQRHLLQRCLNGEYLLGHDSNMHLISREGNKRDIEITLSPMRDSAGEILGVVVVLHDVTQNRTLSKELFHKATHDNLTGLINRYEFEKSLQGLLDEGDGKHVMCYLDLDQFKIINDTCGHIAGDELLRQLTSLLITRVEQKDILARLGGDEFGLLLLDCDIHRAESIVKNLIDTISEFRFTWDDSTFVIGCSAGIVKIGGRLDTAASIFSAADSACYVAKDAGGNRVQVYRDDNKELQQRQGEMEWVGKIQLALDEERLELYMQEIRPFNNSSENEGSHIEILVRLREGDTLHLPGTFIPAAERYNLQSCIDQYVYCRTLDWIKEQPNPPAVVSINLSGKSLPEDGFLDMVKRKLDLSGVDPKRICFEITETAAISNLAYARKFIKTMRKKGCKFSLDDFGSGLSSFAYLKYLPVDYLKIDGLFIQDIIKDPMDGAIVKSIAEIGKVMKMKTIAEFVENEDILNRVEEIGVDFAQGYFIGHPAPLSDWQAK